MNDGTSEHGCNQGSNCEFLHVKICKESNDKRECNKCTKGKRCTDGYHLRGTKTPNKNRDDNNDGKSQNKKSDDKKTSNDKVTGENSEPFDKEAVKSFFAQMFLAIKDPPKIKSKQEIMMEKFLSIFN